MKINISIPSDVPSALHDLYAQRYATITRNTGNLMLFAGDQKLDHLNDDFYGNAIHADAMSPAHLFQIAAQGEIGAFATHLGLIARYGKQFPSTIPYIVKLNGKTNAMAAHSDDPRAGLLWRTADVASFEKSSGLSICGIGYTLYLGSMYESIMLEQAAQEIYHAHQHGYVAILWVYPRGKNIPDDADSRLVAGAAGVAASLGSDFVKIKPPRNNEILRIASMAAGNTKLICAGGDLKEPELFLEELSQQIKIGGAAGCATGRNIFQRPLPQALALTKAISALVLHGKTTQEALAIYQTS